MSRSKGGLQLQLTHFRARSRQLYGDLRTAEAAEASAAEKLFQDQRTAELRTAEAAEQSR